MKKRPDKNEILTRLRAHAGELRALGILHAFVFGSVARGDGGPDSDIDIAVEIDPKQRIGLVALVRLQRHLSELLGGKADVTTLPVRNERLRSTIRDEAIRAF